MNQKIPLSVKDTIQVKRFTGNIPAVAYTDFRFVYLSWLLNGDEYDLAFIHEAGHIWLQHQYRRSQLKKEEGEGFNNQCWLIASDMEIARHLYSDADTYVIERPRSALKGAITYEMTLEYPKCEYAEDFYHELKKSESKGKSTCCQHCESGDLPDDVEVNVSDLLEQAKEELEKIKKHKQSEDTQKKINDFKPPKPSLASEIDRHLGRVKVKRVQSYKRPPRVESCNGFLKKGMSNKLHTPHFVLYVDRSGSFDSTKTAQATNLIQKILKKYRGRISNDVIYFNDTLLVKDPINGSGGTNYTAVVDSIIRDKPKLSIVITDDDGYQKPANLPPLPEIVVVPIGAVSTNLAKELSLLELPL